VRLPTDWPDLTVEQIRLQGLVLRIRGTRNIVEIRKQGAAEILTFT
jgi:hypothetical protein